ncbi:MAG: isoaspartyl peptidase/L-asparaginase [Planctomycetes bacterium]|nr:isoaspartyl peptidase/L-asparaginase [Planctomycetota bacterium]
MVHGGAGRVASPVEGARAAGVAAAVEVARQVLAGGGDALDAAEAAAVFLEEDPAFNAGTGACLNAEGEVEADASVMASDGRSGAVAALRGVRNPIRAARRVMERTDHVLLAGEGAARFAAEEGLPTADLVTAESRRRYREMCTALESGGAGEGLRHLARGRDLARRAAARARTGDLGGTIGAVVRDDRGLLAAATSTGGMWMKLPGRVGDSAVIGAGTYAAPWGAASATGHGEGILRLGLTRRCVDLMRELGAQEACRRAMDEATSGGVECGIIAVDGRGGTGDATNGWMPTARWTG